MSRAEDLFMIQAAVAAGRVRHEPNERERAGVRFVPRNVTASPSVPLLVEGSLAWYPVAVETGREITARDALREILPDVYVPLVKRVFVRRGIKAEATVPLLAGYVFGLFDVGRIRWKAFNDARAVIGLLHMGLAIVKLRKGEIDRVRQQEIAGGIVPKKVEIEFRRGELMRVIDGPFTSFDGRLGRVEIVKGEPRYFVDVNIFGRLTPVEFMPGQIERA